MIVISKFHQKSSMGQPSQLPVNNPSWKNKDIEALQKYRAKPHNTGYSVPILMSILESLWDIHDLKTGENLGWYDKQNFWTIQEWRDLQIKKLDIC